MKWKELKQKSKIETGYSSKISSIFFQIPNLQSPVKHNLQEKKRIVKRKKVKQESEIETGIYHKISSSSFPDPESPISGQVRTYEPTNLRTYEPTREEKN